MAKDDEYPEGVGNTPGGEPRTRRRGALPGADNAAPAPAPLSTEPAPAGVAPDGSLEMTEKAKVSNAKVLGWRVSEAHYDTGTTMVKVLATRYKLEHRQVGELIVQYLKDHRFDLDDYVAKHVGPAIDLDFFTKPQD